MSTGGSIRGVVGRIKWSYYVAAAIEGYTVSRAPNKSTWTLTANVVMADSFKLSRKPLIFEALHERGAWRWAITDFNLAEGKLTANLGPLQEF